MRALHFRHWRNAYTVREVRTHLKTQTTLCMLCLSLFTASGVASTFEPRFSQLSVEDGLVQASVNAITQDRHGFIWIGTQQGLSRYDGIEFRTFLQDDTDPTSLPNDWVRTLHTDRHGRLWVSSLNGGIAYFDERTEQFVRSALPDNLQDVRAITETSDGAFWLAANEGGLAKYTPADGALQHFRLSQIHPDVTQIKVAFMDSYAHLWVGSEGAGLFLYDALKDTFDQIEGVPRDSTVTSITTAGDTTLYIATSEQGVYALDQLSGQITKIDGLSSEQAKVLLVDQTESLWVGLDTHGITRISGEHRHNMRTDSGLDHSIVDNHVRALFEDRVGNIWVGTQRGISLWSPNSNGFSNFQDGEGEAGLSGSWISNFAEASPSEIWVSIYGGGINRVDLEDRSVEHFSSASTREGLSDDRVMALQTTSDGELWAGTFKGISILSNDGSWRQLRREAGNPNSLAHHVITDILQDTKDRIWIATHKGGLHLYRPQQDDFLRYNQAWGMCSDRTLNLFEDRRGILWIGTLREGLCRFDPETETVTHFKHDPTDPTSLSSDAAWLVIEDQSGNLWIGTDNGGINVWLAEDRVANRVYFHRINRAQGMASNVVYSLLVDARERLWVGSNIGLTRYQFDFTNNGPEINNRKHFSADDGLPGNEFNFAAAMRSSNGRMVFGGTSGFTTFRPEASDHDRPHLPLALTRFSRVNTPELFLQDQPNFSIAHDDQLIRFEYSALDFAAPKRIRYQHKLEGFDDTWVDNGNRNQATYTNLDAGDYIFMVRAAREGEDFSQQTLSANLSVASAPWATPAAYAAYILLLSLMALYAYQVWMHRVRAAAEISNMNKTLVAEVDRRQSRERELQLAQQKIEQYLAVAEVPILALDDVGTITMINRKGARMLGLRDQDIIGQSFVDHFVPSDEQAQLRRILRGLTHYQYSESHLLGSGGNKRLIAWQMVRLGSQDAPPNGILLSGNDLTQMRKLEKQLLDGQKMEALGTLARGVAHDFNNVLSAILGYAEQAGAHVSPDSPARTHLHRLEMSVDRAKEVVQNILLFSRANQVPREVVNLSAVVTDALQLVRPIIKANVRLHERIDPEVGPILVNPGQITQILLNLCSNACQSMEDLGGDLYVSLSQTEVSAMRARDVGVLTPGKYAVLEVVDTGIGMDEYTRARVYEPFFTTRGAGEGSGLGLSVVHGVVTQLGGSIQLESQPGRGTQFSILLPCQDAVMPEGQNQAQIEAIAGQANVLFVEDEAELAQMAQLALSELGYTVKLASDGQAALQILDDPDQHIDIMVTDQTMPGMRGEDLAAAARERDPTLPILLISGAAPLDSPHISNFLAKPYRKVELTQQIQLLLEPAGAED